MNENILSSRLKEAREDRGYTQGEMAEKLGIARTSLSLYEGGQRTPDAHVITRFSEVTGASPYYLLGLRDTKNDEYSDIFQELALSEHAIDRLRDKKQYAKITSKLLESDSFWGIVNLINILIDYYSSENEYSSKGFTIEDGMIINFDDAHRYSCQRYLENIIDEVLEGWEY